MVPRMSSPSQPGMRMTGTLMDSSSSSMMGNCAFRSGSMGGRWALYCSRASMRNAGRPASKAQMTASGCAVSTNFMNMDMNPNTALVGVPSGAFMVGGTAWNARCMSEFPSMTAIFLVIGASLPTRRHDRRNPCKEPGNQPFTFSAHDSGRSYPKRPKDRIPLQFPWVPEALRTQRADGRKTVAFETEDAGDGHRHQSPRPPTRAARWRPCRRLWPRCIRGLCARRSARGWRCP